MSYVDFIHRIRVRAKKEASEGNVDLARLLRHHDDAKEQLASPSPQPAVEPVFVTTEWCRVFPDEAAKIINKQVQRIAEMLAHPPAAAAEPVALADVAFEAAAANLEEVGHRFDAMVIRNAHKSAAYQLAGLRAELAEAKELHVMQMAAVCTAAMMNTRESAKERIGKDNPYWTQAYQDVCDAVDREMTHREAALAKRDGWVLPLLRDISAARWSCATEHGDCPDCGCEDGEPHDESCLLGSVDAKIDELAAAPDAGQGG